MILRFSNSLARLAVTGLTLGLPGTAPAASLISADATTTSLRLPALFTDHMVLQRETQCPVWGWAAPGQTVTVTLSGVGTTGTAEMSAVTDAEGKWSVRIGPFPAGGPGALKIASPEETRTLRDVLIGEVWLCSGQSNMDWQVAQSLNPEATVADSSNTQIRLFAVPHRSVPHPLTDIPDSEPWRVCGPESIAGFSAVAYFFGKDLHERLNVPVGLIKSAAGGTPAESWTSREGLESFPEFAGAIADLNAEPIDSMAAQALFTGRAAEWTRKRDAADPGYDADATSNSPGNAPQNPWRWTGLSVDTSSWKTLQIPGKWEEQGHPEFDGTAWLRKEIELPEQVTESSTGLVLHLGGVDDFEETWFNGQRLGEGPGRGRRRYEIPAKLVHPGTNAVTVRVTDTGGGGGFNGSPAEFFLETTGSAEAARVSLAGEWKLHFGADQAGLPPHPLPPGNWNRPTGLYNGMIAPLVPYGIRGVIWYQGESNAVRAWRYRALFPAMIADWRRLWKQGDFPFLYVQLANFLPRKESPGEDPWAELREAQLQTLQVPNTGMASAVDIGDAGDIHPRNKQDVGKRLARAARAIAYGETVEWSGPLYSGMAVEGNSVRVRFTHTDGGLKARNGELKGFAIAGEDRVFVWGNARIEGNTVVVSSPEVPRPVAVRYAWAINPDSTLYNGEGLPASPFRTDDWPAITRDAR